MSRPRKTCTPATAKQVLGVDVGLDPTRPPDGASAWETPHGLVYVTAPSGAGVYYRIFWGKPRKNTTGGRTFEQAWRVAVEKESELLRGASALTTRTVNEGIDYWLSPGRGTARGTWGHSQAKNMAAYARNYFRPVFGAERSMDLRRSHIQKVVNMAPTRSEGQNLRRAASSLISALRQGEFLPDELVIDLSSVWWHDPGYADAEEGFVVSSKSEADAETIDELGGFVARHSRPSNDQVRALREAAEKTGRRGGVWWRGLMVELAAYSGPRWSELIALVASDVDTDERQLAVVRRVEFPTGKKPRLVAPKMAKRRTTFFPEISPTGYPLAEMLKRRVAEVHEERKAGRNPRSLLFPSSRGTWLMTGNFHRDIFQKAATLAGWDSVLEERPYAGGTRAQRKWALTWHSLRHTFCTVALEEYGMALSTVATMAGHADPNTTMRLYVGASEDALAEAKAKTAGPTPVDRARKELIEAEARVRALRSELGLPPSELLGDAPTRGVEVEAS